MAVDGVSAKVFATRGAIECTGGSGGDEVATVEGLALEGAVIRFFKCVPSGNNHQIVN